ncbi:MAG: protease [Porticoccaceae bacterium]|nr:protease [Porticoccaceae bacterium]
MEPLTASHSLDSQKKVAVLLADGFEDSELTVPLEYLQSRGVRCELIGSEADKGIAGKHGYRVATDKAVTGVDERDYDGLLIPGGHSPDKLRADEAAVAFVKAFFNAGKPVAAICHGPQLLIDADVVDGKTVTSWPSVQTDLKNAGANWLDRELVLDGNLITSRRPSDLPVFCSAFADFLLGEG